jgi:hypothetical protein
VSTITDFKTLILEGDLTRPYSIRTKANKVYQITEGSEIFVTNSYPNLLIMAIPGKGINLMRLSSIDAVECKHESLPE